MTRPYICYTVFGWNHERATIDNVEAHGIIQEVASFYRKEKEDCDTDFSHICVQSVSMAGRVDTNAKMSPVPARQQHRSNAEAQTTKMYFKRNVAIPIRPHHHEYQ